MEPTRTLTLYQPIPMVKFDFTEAVQDRYTNGDCWILANSLCKQIPSTTVVVLPDGDGWIHAGTNLNNNGFIIDVEGVWQRGAWLSYWGFQGDELHRVDNLISDHWYDKELFTPLDEDDIFPPQDTYDSANRVAHHIHNQLKENDPWLLLPLLRP